MLMFMVLPLNVAAAVCILSRVYYNAKCKKRAEKSKLKCETSRQYDIHYLPVGGDKLEQRRKTLAKKFK